MVKYMGMWILCSGVVLAIHYIIVFRVLWEYVAQRVDRELQQVRWTARWRQEHKRRFGRVECVVLALELALVIMLCTVGTH